jgi:hypothetical protein
MCGFKELEPPFARPKDAGRSTDAPLPLFSPIVAQADTGFGRPKASLIKILAALANCHDFAARLTFYLFSQTVR